MSGGLDAITDIGLGDILSEAADLGSVVTDLGTEFASSFDITSFEVPGFDVSSLGGFDIAGSFAGSADWFDTFNPGSILSGIPSVSDFSLPSLPSLPSLASLNVNKLVSSATSSFGIPSSITSTITKTLSNPSLVTAGAAALGINPSIALSASRVLAGGSPVAAGAAALGISPQTTALVTRGISSATNVVADVSGINILSDAETVALEKRNLRPGFVNSLTDPAVNSGNAVDAATGLPINTARPVANEGPTNLFTEAYDPETEQWSVFNNTTGVTTQSNLTEQEAILAAQELNITGGTTLNSTPTNVELTADQLLAEAVAANQATNEETSPTETDVTSFLNQARNQQTVRDLRQNKAAANDWRVRLRLAPNSTYLYNDPQPGLLAPLAGKTGTDGVIFPYTPNIETAYKANYDAYDLTHSNYRGYFYKNSHVDVINIRATFTAQDTEEANYLLAVIHFFRSATKMFYGKDAQRGSPPPLVYLSGYGDFQFNEHPCVISQFNYTLPSDVDYIRAGSAVDASTSMLGNRVRQSTPGNPLSYAINRLLNNSLTKGALDNRPNIVSNFAVGEPTYVPTKIEISVSLLPMQSRQQVSKQFSLQAFANGNQLKGGFW